MADETPTSQQAMPTPEAERQKFENLRGLFIGGVILAVLIFVGWGGATLMAEMSQKQIQREYLSLTDEASRGSFAKRHGDHPMGGLVLLGQANEYYNNGNYAAAKTAYAQVVISGLKLQPSYAVFAEQAMLGQAFSSYALDPAKGLAELKGIAENTALMQSTRAYAACELAGSYAAKNDFKSAGDYLQLIKTFNYAKPWQHQASTIAEIYPELAPAAGRTE